MSIRLSRAGLPCRSWLLHALAAILLLSADRAESCQICAKAFSITPGQQLAAADQAVLALPAAGESRLRIVEVVKGGGTVGAIIAEEMPRVDAAALASGKPLLLLRDALNQRWSSIGSISAEHVGWLRQLAAVGNPGRGQTKANWPRTTQTPSELMDAEWRDRLALVFPYLEHAEPLAAEIAYGELARAPYGVMRSLKAQLQAAKIAEWIDDTRLATRRSAYLLLLGFTGGADDAARLEQRIEAAHQARDATDLAAMLAADLELSGPSRVGWIEEAYFNDRSRSLPEIQAALLALRVHGAADAAVPRARVIEAYRLFIRERPPMAGFVAQQLADWDHWDATAEYITLLKSDAVKDPASHFAVVNYLNRSPDAAAKAAIQSIAEKSR